MIFKKFAHYIILIAATIIALVYGLVSGHVYLFLCFVGFVIIIVAIILFYAARKERHQPDKEEIKEKIETKTTVKAKKHWRRYIVWAILIIAIFAILKFFPTDGFQKILSQLREYFPTSATPSYNYRPTFVSEDAWKNELNYANFTGKYFDVTLREGCWGGYIILPTAWSSEWHFQVLGNDSGTWIAFWFPRYPPAGPYGRNAIVEFPNHPMKFRLQGKGIFRFYQS